MTKFSDWLTIELAQRDISPAKLARLTKKDQGVISRILSGERQPSVTTLKAIAHALNKTAKAVFEAAGLLPPSGEDTWVEEMAHKLASLPPNLRRVASGLIDSLLRDEVIPARKGAK